MRKSLSLFSSVLLLLMAACAPSQEQPTIAAHPQARAQLARGQDPADFFSKPPSIPDLATGKTKPPTSEELEEGIGAASSRWFYGPGFGRTLLNVGTVVAFPPYALYLLGNAGLALAGYEPLYVSDALPEPVRGNYLYVYDSVTEAPGRLNAVIADREFYEEKPIEADSQEELRGSQEKTQSPRERLQVQEETTADEQNSE